MLTSDAAILTPMTIGQRIKQARNEAGLTQSALARLCRISRAAVSQWEADETVPTGPNLVSLSRALKTGETWLMTGKGSKTADEGLPPASPAHYSMLRALLRQSGIDRAMAAQLGASVEDLASFATGARDEVGEPGLVRTWVEERVDKLVPADLRGEKPIARRDERDLPPRETLSKDVRVLGTAQCGDDGAFHLNSGDPIDWVRRPSGIQHKRDVYAIYVEGDSMMPAYRPGALVYVDPNRKPFNGCDVIVQLPARQDGDGPLCYLKRLVRRTPSHYVVEQFNPPKELHISTDALIHRVLTLEELLGI